MISNSQIFLMVSVVASTLALPFLSHAIDVKEWNGRFDGMGKGAILDAIITDSDEWPELVALERLPEKERKATKQIVATVMSALKDEAYALDVDLGATALLGKVKRAARVAEIVSKKGGYLNDLVAISAQKIVIFGASLVLVGAPERAAELGEVVSSAAPPKVKAKRWFLDYIGFDRRLRDKVDRLEDVPEDATGFQTMWALNRMKNTWGTTSGHAFRMIDDINLTAMWQTREGNAFKIEAVIPAAVDFLKRGGTLIPVPQNKPEAVAAIYGADGLPFKHELRSGRIYAEDIWRLLARVTDRRKRDIGLKFWFGEQ